jgi:TonB-dependent SusC/RagA subfamily outer membrane receptor
MVVIPCHAQDQTVTLHLEGPLSYILDTFEGMTNCRFTYKAGDIANLYVHVRIKKMPVTKAVGKIFDGLPVKARLTGQAGGKLYYSVYVDSTASTSGVNLPAAVVKVDNNGLQQFKKSTATGSIVELQQPDFRVVSANAIDQLPWLIPGLLPDGNVNNPLNLTIHGRNSLHAINSPFALLDGFVNFANPQDFNPNDIASYSVMKDAAAASIWGTNGANGVIAATTYSGKPAGSFHYTLTQDVTFQGKPNLRYPPRISIPSYVAMEEAMFAQGYYDGIIPTYRAITPVVATLYQQRSHQLSPASAAAMISYQSGSDLRDEIQHYLYRNSMNEQVHLSAAGCTKDNHYYLSMGYDVVPTSLVRNDYQRVTVQFSDTHELDSNRLELMISGHLAATQIYDNNTGTIPVSYPYGPLADSKGDPLPVNYLYSPLYIDTTGGGQLMNWQYRPLQELALADNRLHRTSGYFDARLTYNISRRFSASAEYRQWLSGSEEHDLYDQNMFYVRNMVNRYSQPGPQGITYNIPPGDMLFIGDTSEQSHHLRFKMTYKTPDSAHDHLIVFAGADLNDLSVTARSYWQYGYNPRTGQSQPVNLGETFTDYVSGAAGMIPGQGEPLGQYYRYLSVYGNVSYSFQDRLSFYGSLRKDATNIVGQTANLQWAPFWAVGFAWQLKHDPKPDTAAVAWAKLRTSMGSSGNIGDRIAYMQTQSLGLNLWNAPQDGISSAPDPGLTWETTYVWNTGFDYGFFKDRLSPEGRLRGSLDVYLKWSVNLLGYDTLPPSAGVPVFYGNSAATRGHGLDWVLNSDNIRGDFRWTSTLMFSWTTDRVTRYMMQPAENGYYIAGVYPKKGKSSTALFAYDWAGLDGATGDPRGYLNHQPSNNYSALINGNQGMHAYSSYLPQVFGSLINTFQYKNLRLSAMFTFKAAYWVRRPSIDYTQMLAGAYPGTKDYDNRWQVSGDEKRTSVPSFPSAMDWNNTSRDAFYQNSSVLVIKGDHLRWQDIRLDYLVRKKAGDGHGVYQLDLYGYVSGLGIIWRSNRYGVDPDAFIYGELPAVRTYSLGIRMNF